MVATCIQSAPVFTTVLILGIAILALQTAGWGRCRKCGKAHREPVCRMCEYEGGGPTDHRKVKFTDPLSKKRRGEKDE